ncbi:hypothetical protein GCM10028784_25840 [Myceligenerans cantabricum]
MRPLDAEIPAKAAKSLLIGTWNVHAFGDLTHRVGATPSAIAWTAEATAT